MKAACAAFLRMQSAVSPHLEALLPITRQFSDAEYRDQSDKRPPDNIRFGQPIFRTAGNADKLVHRGAIIFYDPFPC